MAGEGRRRKIRKLLSLLDADHLDTSVLEPAFVHASGASEQQAPSNERLEFLGDSILGYVTARWLYHTYPTANEGELARRKAALASDEAIAQTGRRLGLGELLVLGQGERASGGAERTSNIGDAFEALVAVVEAVLGLETAQRFIEMEHLKPLAEQYGPEVDTKTALQELAQARFRSTPTYHDEGEEGLPHVRIFHARVELSGETLGRGSGASKKLAQRAAATDALSRLRSKEEAS